MIVYVYIQSSYYQSGYLSLLYSYYQGGYTLTYLSYVANTRVVINNEQPKGVEVSPESKEVPVGNGVEDGISVGSSQDEENMVGEHG